MSKDNFGKIGADQHKTGDKNPLAVFEKGLDADKTATFGQLELWFNAINPRRVREELNYVYALVKGLNQYKPAEIFRFLKSYMEILNWIDEELIKSKLSENILTSARTHVWSFVRRANTIAQPRNLESMRMELSNMITELVAKPLQIPTGRTSTLTGFNRSVRATLGDLLEDAKKTKP